MESSIVAEVVKEQFARTWQSLREIVQAVPADEWRRGETPSEVPARWAYHIVAAADCYSTRLTYDEYRKVRTMSPDYRALAPEELPSQEEIGALIDGMQAQVGSWLDDLRDAGLLAPETSHVWTGATLLSRALYALRHSQHHIGELNGILRNRGLLDDDGGKWA